MKTKEKITILGAGEIGSALDYIIRKKGIEPVIWDKDSSKLRQPLIFSEAIKDASIIFLCVPSWVNREVARSIRENTAGDQKIVITLSKGLEENSAKTMDEVLAEELKDRADFGILAGPMLAEELKKDQPAAGVIGLSNKKWRPNLRKLFSKTNLKVQFSDDIRGLALCSVLKNVYSLALGMADGFGLGANTKSFLTVEIFKEMEKIVKHLGGNKKTARGLAGLGDLLATGWSSLSHNFSTGRSIAAEGEKCPRSEGCVSVGQVKKLLETIPQKFEIFNMLSGVILEGKDARETFFKIFRDK